MFLFNRKFLLVALMAAAAFVPYVWNNQDLANRVRSLLTSAANSTGNAPATSFSNTAPTTDASWSPWKMIGNMTSTQPAATTPPPAPPPPIDYAEILRFDLPPESILQRWPRVNTVAPEAGLTGLRVPLVTGMREDDLAGSLTYYFDNRRQMQRIVMQGYTGDPRRIVTLVTQQQRFQPLPSLSAGMYVAVQNNEPQGLLQIVYAPVIDAADPHHRASVVLELNRPGSYLSAAGRQLLQQDKHLSGW